MARPRAFDVDSVLDLALEAFRVRGFDGTSIDDLEKATGLRRASLYAAYGDKRALYLAALRRCDATRTVRLLDRLNRERNGRAAIESVFAAVLEEAAGDPRGCLLTGAAFERAAHDEGVARCVGDHRRRMEGGLAASLLRGRADGSVKGRGEARAEARFLFAALLGLRALAKTGCGRAELKAVARRALTSLDH